MSRLVHKADFEKLLTTRSRGRSAHFAVHHVPGAPARPSRAQDGASAAKLSTDDGQVVSETVDNPSAAQWLGFIVPKRQARRSVTRNLLRRQMRESFHRHAAALPQGLWLLRLHAGFPARDYPAARSDALAQAARTELDRLLLAAGQAPASRRADASA